jgi:hypothetical protein
MVDFARSGAMARLNDLRSGLDELKSEVVNILTMFPELKNGAAVSTAAKSQARRVRRWTPAQRKAVAERMRRYWAERRSRPAKPSGR